MIEGFNEIKNKYSFIDGFRFKILSQNSITIQVFIKLKYYALFKLTGEYKNSKNKIENEILYIVNNSQKFFMTNMDHNIEFITRFS